MPFRSTLFAAFVLVAVSCSQQGSSNASAPGVKSQKSALEAKDATPDELTWPELPRSDLQLLKLKPGAEFIEPSGVDESVKRPASVKLPTMAGRPFEVRDVDVAVRVTLLGQQPVPAMVKDGVVLYSGGLKGAHVLMRPSSIGVEDFVTLDAKQEPFVDYDVELEGIAGLRLHADQLEFLTDDGNPRLRMRAPFVITKQGESVPARVSVHGCPVDTSPVVPWGRKVQPCTAGRVTVHLAWELAADAYPALLDPGWTTTGSLAAARAWAPTVTLGDGRVLTTAGFTGNGAGAFSMVSSTEVFDPVAGTWAATGGGTGPVCYNAPALWLPAQGMAYVFGGGRGIIGQGQLAEVRAYNPATGTWSLRGSMWMGLEQHTATLMGNGRVFIANGVNGLGASATRMEAGCVYDPVATNCSFINLSFAGGRAAHVAALLPNGNVIVSHGLLNPPPLGAGGYNMTSVIFNPSTNTGAMGPPVVLGREFAAATTMSNGQVLVTGGAQQTGPATYVAFNQTEIYDPGSNTFAAARPMISARYHHQQLNLPSGRVLVAGGENPADTSINRTEVYSTAATTWADGLNLASARRETGIALTGQNYAIVAGGGVGSGGAGTFSGLTSTEAFELLPNGSPCPGPGVCSSRLCVDGVCCNSACNAGTCDSCAVPASVGTCSPSPATTVCRNAGAGGCDVAENCTGMTTTCPADGFAGAGTTCRAAGAGGCDVAETCPGGTPNCPADGFAGAGTVCRAAAAGGCDVAETCAGGTPNCPANSFAPATTVCRSAAAGGCDVAENCTGSAAACPADGFRPASFTCRAAATVCDVAENCPGNAAACPTDSFAANTVVCRPDAGACDVAERCTGSSSACPGDSFQPASVTCRGAAGVCDVAERCTGSSAACPANAFAANTVVCRPDAGECDVAERCTGSAAACPGDGFLAATVTCRGSAGVCDVAETCTGSGAACPTDVFQANTVVCRPDAGACDVAETCTGSAAACPNDAVQPATVACRGAADLCDAIETCDGTGVNCPADLFAPATTVCRGNQGTCDVVETCSGSSITCGTDTLVDAGTVCDTTYVCTGIDAGCPTTCTMEGDCAIGATCVNGTCVISLPPGSPCTSNANCTSGFCVDGVCCNTACDQACATCNQAGSVGTCAAEPAGAPGMPSCSPYLCDGSALICPGSCANDSQCVSGFVCVAGRCVNTLPNGGECTADAQCASGFCTDGVCCNSRCDQGACQACNTPGAVGTCSIAGRGEPGSPSCAPFVCDGASPECPTTCEDDAACGPPAFCENSRCVDRTRGHVGFSCGGCSSVDGASLLGLLTVASLLRRRRAPGGAR